jgi:hypothetical protein
MLARLTTCTYNVGRQLDGARYLSRARFTSKVDHVTNGQELRECLGGQGPVVGSFRIVLRNFEVRFKFEWLWWPEEVSRFLIRSVTCRDRCRVCSSVGLMQRFYIVCGDSKKR